jgi:hypothetical protein
VGVLGITQDILFRDLHHQIHLPAVVIADIDRTHSAFDDALDLVGVRDPVTH